MSISDLDDHWLWNAPGATAVFTSLETGNLGLHVGDDPTRVAKHRCDAADLLQLDPSRVAGVTQVHGTDVWLDLGTSAALPHEVRWDQGPAPIEADALVTTRPDVALAVGVADCLPIAVVWGDAIAAIHAGWRSLDGGIVKAALAVLRRAAGSAVALADCAPRAVVGPALCPECFEVGEEVAARFNPSSIVRRAGAERPFLDARTDATRRLEAAGCAVEHVDLCTRCDPRLFSHRGDGGSTGRQAVLVRRTQV